MHGDNKDYLFTGRDDKGNLYTYWGIPQDDTYTTVAESGLTVKQLNDAFATFADNDETLIQHDLNKITISQNNNEETIIFKDGKDQEISSLTFSSGGGTYNNENKNYDDTYISIKDKENNEIRLNTGSKVEVDTAFGTDDVVKTLTVNGKEYSIVHTAVTVNGGNEPIIGEDGKFSDNYTDGNLQLKATENDGQVAYDVKLNNTITLGEDNDSGKIVIKNRRSADVITLDGEHGNISASGNVQSNAFMVYQDGVRTGQFNSDGIETIKGYFGEQARAHTEVGTTGLEVYDASNKVTSSLTQNTLTVGENNFIVKDNGDTVVGGNVLTIGGENGYNIRYGGNKAGKGKQLVLGGSVYAWGDVDSSTGKYNGLSIVSTTKDYDKNDRSGGSRVANVAYASGTDGSEAVNVDYLKNYVGEQIGDIQHTTVTGSANITVTPNADPDKAGEYKVELNPNVDLGKDGSLHVGNNDVDAYIDESGVAIKNAIDGNTTNITASGMNVTDQNGSQTNVSAGGVVISVKGEDGETVEKVQLNESGLTVGDNVHVTDNGFEIEGGPSVTKDGIDAGDNRITNVAKGVNDTDAVNVSQLNDATNKAKTEVQAGSRTSVDESTGDKGQKIYTVNADSYSVSAGEGITVAPTTSVNNDDGTQNHDFKVSVDYDVIAKTNLSNINDEGKTIISNIAQQAVTVEEGANAAVEKTVSDDGLSTTYTVNAWKTDVEQGNSGNIIVRTEQTGDYTNTVTVDLAKDIAVDSVKVGDKVNITKDGIDAGDTKIVNVTSGEVSETSKDAVNGSQLHATNQAVQNNAENISRLGHTVDKLGSRVNKVGAGAAALAAMHPLDFDPDEKLNVAAGYGHYKGEDAASIGAFYRPNEDTMFSIGGTVGNGEDMINVGVSFRFGQQNHQTRTKKEMAKEIIDLRMEVAELKAMMYNLSGSGISLDPAKQELFPDVPENHWAYEYVAALKGNGILEGYADGSFDGARPMTRYEFAAALYRALGKGVAVDERMLKEFGDVLARICVDVLTRDHNNEPRIERVRVIPKAEQKAARGLVQPVNAAK